MRVHAMLVVCAVLCATTSTMLSQVEARTQLNRLPWRGGSPNITFTNFNDLWDPDYHQNHLVVGWNWIASPRVLSEGLRAPVLHRGDEWIWREDAAYQAVHQPGRRLVPAIFGINSTLADRDRYVSPCESNALEFAPWLSWNAATERMNLEPTDATGSTFGFRDRRLGQIDPPVNVNAAPGSVQYRYRLQANTVTHRDTVLCDVWPDDELRVFGNTWSDEIRRDDRVNHNMTEMYVSVTVNRRSPVTQDEAAHADDEVLRITIPFWMGKVDGNQPGGRIRFQWLTDAADPIEGRQIETNVVGMRRDRPTIELTGNTDVEEFIITRGMLPAVAVNQDVTIEARFLCNWEGLSADDPDDLINANGALIPRPNGEAWRNPRFYPNDINVHNEDFPDLISRYDVVVEYSGGIDVDIKSVRLETAGARQLFWGELDEQIVGPAAPTVQNPGAIMRYFLNLEDRNDWLLLQDPANGVNGDVARVWRFYGRDEIMPMQWKSFRYLNRLLDGHLITEVGIWWDEGMRHGLGLNELWQGATFAVHPGVASYAFEQGFVQPAQSIPVEDSQARHENRLLHAGLDRGRLTFGRDPDLQISSNSTDFALPLTVEQQQYITSHNGGIQAHIEYYLHDLMRPHRQMLFSPDAEHHWYANIWQFSAWDVGGTTDPANPHFLTAAGNARPKSCGELRAQMWSSLVLGAHGLLFYCGEDQERVGQGGLRDPNAALLEGDRVVDAGLVFARHETVTQPAPTFVNVMNEAAFGSDWLEANDLSNMDAWLFTDVQQTANALAVRQNAVPRMYLGRMAMRQIAHEVLGRLDNSARETLSHLKLRGWHARGFRTYSTSAENPTGAPLLAARIEIGTGTANRLRTRKPGQTTVDPNDPNYPGNPGIPVWDAPESTFVDVTLLSDVGDMDMTDAFYVGVFNRRTNPMMIIPPADTLAFHTYAELREEWNDHPERLYDQEGAREVLLPFKVPHLDGRYRLLRITEVGSPDLTVTDNITLTRPSLDTVIGQDRELSIMLLPGEGRIYHVRFLEAEQRVDRRGFLDHNTQRKLVVHPDLELDPVTQLPVTTTNPITERSCTGDNGSAVENRPIVRVHDGEHWRYHMVYHRRINDDDPQAPGPLATYYRRSLALQDAPASDGNSLLRGVLEWEPEINVSAFLAGSAELAPSCGYPSLVVRYDEIRRQNIVYIVFACERPGTGLNDDITICEAQIPADVTRPEQLVALGQPLGIPMQLDVVRSSGVNVNERLHHWGTPVVNASCEGNFYAWSDHQRGIVFGYKLPGQRLFGATGGLQWMKAVYQYLGQNWVSKYPTMHSYSRIGIGELDAAMAWQEGEDIGDGIGRQIFYTRLRYAPNVNTVLPYLTPAQQVNPQTLTQTNGENALLSDGRILQVSQRPPGINGRNEMPTLLRLQSEFPDEFAGTAPPLANVGHLNHKPDRIVWEKTVDNRPNTQDWSYPMLAHRVIDLTDRCVVGGAQAATELWTTPEAWIWSLLSLRQPELMQGEMKTSLFMDPQTNPEFVARSWDYDDTTLVLAFAGLGGMNRHGVLYQLNYGYDLYASEDDYGVWEPVMLGLAHGRQLTHWGRSPHAAARHSVVHSQGLFKGRRIYEEANSDDNTEIPNGWWRAPFITRTNEGFFKETTAQADEGLATRRWIGYAGAAGSSTMIQPELGDRPWILQNHGERNTPNGARSAIGELATEWAGIVDAQSLDLETRFAADNENVRLYFQRERDGARTQFAVADGHRKQRWMLIPDPGERYRLVVERTDADLGLVTDLELDAQQSDLGKVDVEGMKVLDLRTMGTGLQAVSGRVVEVWPQPASEMLNVLTRVGQTPQPAMITMRSVHGEVVLRRACKTIDHVQLATGSLPSGTYSMTMDADNATLAHVMISIMR